MAKGGYRGGMGGGMNMNMIKQAQKMQQDMLKMQEEKLDKNDGLAKLMMITSYFIPEFHPFLIIHLLFHPDLSEAFLLPLKTHFPAFLTGFPFCLLGFCLNHNPRDLHRAFIFIHRNH